MPFTSTNEKLVNTTTTNDEFTGRSQGSTGDQDYRGKKAVAIDAEGDIVVVWSSYDPSNSDVFHQRFARQSGTSILAQGTEQLTNTKTADSQFSASVAVDGDGDYVVVWTSKINDNAAAAPELRSTYGVFARRYDKAGNALDSDTLINSTKADDQYQPAIARITSGAQDGEYVIAWTSKGQDAGASGIYFKKFAADGTEQVNETKVGAPAGASEFNPAIAINAKGDFVITWDTPDGDTSGGAARDVYAQAFDKSGVAIGTAFRVNVFTTDAQASPSVALDDTGNFVIAWSSKNQKPGVVGVYGRRFKIASGAVSALDATDIEIDGAVGDGVDNATPSVGINPTSGNFTVAWVGADANGEGIYAKRYSAGFGLLDAEFLVNTATIGAQNNPSVSVNAKDDAVITWTGQDTASGSQGVLIRAFTVPLDPPPVITISNSAVVYTEDQAAIAIVDPTFNITDDTGNLREVSIEITGFVAGQDKLNLPAALNGLTPQVTANKITLKSANATGDPAASFVNVIRNITFESGQNPTSAVRTIQIQAIDPAAVVGAAARSLTVQPRNDNPTVTASTGNTVYDEGKAPVVVDSSLTLGDIDDTNLEGATVTIQGYKAAQNDRLIFTNQNGITGNFDSTTGILTLTGTAALASYTTALQSVKFGSDDGSNNRTIEFKVTDGEGEGSAPKVVAIQAVNDPPVIKFADPTVTSITFREGDPALKIDALISVIDEENDPLSGVRITLSNYVPGSPTDPQDVIEFTIPAGSGINALPSVQGNQYILRLTGTASVAVYQDILRSLSFRNPNLNPNTTDRSISIAAEVEQDVVSTITRTIKVINVAGPPLLSMVDAPYTVNERTERAIDGSLTLKDSDSNIKEAVVEFTSGFLPEDELRFNPTATITGSFDPATKKLILTGEDTPEAYQDALRSIQYYNSNRFPNTSTVREISVTVKDTSDLTTTDRVSLTVLDTTDPPVIEFGTTPTTYAEKSAAIAIAPNLVTSDEDSSDWFRAIVQIQDFRAAEDQLEGLGTLPTGITADTSVPGTITLTGQATKETYQAALRQIGYSNSSNNPTGTTRNIRFSATDDAGFVRFGGSTRAIAIQSQNDLPVVTLKPGPEGYVEVAKRQVIDAALTITDADDTQLKSITITISDGFIAGEDSLDFDAARIPTGVIAKPGNTADKLVFEGNATLSAYQALLRSIVYINGKAAPTEQTRKIQVTVVDSKDGVNSPAVTEIAVRDNKAPIVTLSTTDAIAYSEGGTPIGFDAALTVTDTDSANLTRAVIQLSSATTGDTLIYDATKLAGLTATPGDGSLTFEGTATKEIYQALLQTVQYRNTSNDPATTSRSIDLIVRDEFENSDTVRRFLVITANAAPVLAPDTGAIAYIEGQTVAIATGITLTDTDSANLQSLTVTIDGFIAAEDEIVLPTTLPANIATTGFDVASRSITFTGESTLDNYRTLLQGLNYRNKSSDPSDAGRTLQIRVNDGVENSNVASRSIGVTKNAAPTVSLQNAIDYTEGQNAVFLDKDLAIADADPDPDFIASATITIQSYDATKREDVLSFTTSLLPSGVTTTGFDPATGILTFSGNAPLQAYGDLLRSVTYKNSSSDPSTTARAIAVVVNDGIENSLPAIVTIGITSVATTPVIDTTDTALQYAEQSGAKAIDDGLLVLDADSPVLKGAAVEFIDGTFADGQDVLSFSPTAGVNITGSWDATVGKLTLSGDATVAEYQAALRSITFANNSGDPNTRTRRLAFSANDETGKGLETVREIAIAVVNSPPLVTPAPGTATYTENALPVKVDANLQVSDVDSLKLVGARVKITNVQPGDLLGFAPQASINGSYDAATGELVLSGDGTVADYQSVLRSVTFSTPSEKPDATPRKVDFIVSDSNSSSLVKTRTVNVVPVNDPPLVTLSGPSFTYADNAGAVAVDAGIALSDLDNDSLTEATVELANYIAGEDLLALTATSTITGNFNLSTGRLTLTGTATLADYEAALRTVTYSNTAANPTLSDRTLRFTVNDGESTSQPVTRLIKLNDTNQPPTVTTTTATPLVYQENAGALAIDTGLVVADPDSLLLTGATVAIASYIATEERLSFTPQGPITGSFNATTGILTLSGSASVANYQAALRTVSYSNSSSNPTALSRTIKFSVNDGSNTSAVRDRLIQISTLNSAPFVAALNSALLYTEGTGAIAIDPSLVVQDSDSPNLTQATVTLTGFVAGEDILSFAPQAGITGSFNSATGVLSFTGEATVANYQTLLRSVTYVNANGNPTTTNRAVQFIVRDASINSNIATRSIRITATNDAPVLTSDITRKTFDKAVGVVSLDQQLLVTDSDSPNLTGATLKFEGYIPGQDNLAFLDQNGITGSSNGATGELVLTGTATVAAYQRALQSIIYINNSDQPDLRPRKVEISVTDGSTRSNSIAIQINFDEASNLPVLDVNGGGLGTDYNNTFTIVGDPVPIMAADARILGSGNLTSVQVVISNAFDKSQEELLVNTEGTGLTASYGDNKTFLKLTGNASSETYLQVLRTIRYVNRSAQPDRTTRVILFNAIDGDRRSETTQTTMQITQVNLRGGTPSEDRFLVTTPGTDFIDAFGSNDTVSSIVEYLQQDDTIDGGLGIDTLKLTDGTGNATVDLQSGSQLRGILRGKTVVSNFEYFDFSGFNGTAQMTGSDRQDDRLMGGSGSDRIAGNTGADLLMGNGGNDALDGGVGNDTMIGGSGDDEYIVDSFNDIVTEAAEGGFDTVVSRLSSYKLLDQFEDLRLSGGAIAGTGNAAANRLTGNDLDNMLDGDLGNDFLISNGGNDTLIGNLGNDELRGGAGNDRLTGGMGNDRLYGDRGKDWLSGGKGRDTFTFSSRKDGGDRMTDFNVKDDTILISRAGFNRNFKRGRISADQFALGGSARDRGDRFIYNQGSGSLFYDADGVGGSRQVLLAQLTNKAALTRADIVIVR